MKNVLMNFKEYSLYFGMFFLALGFTSCSDDDDGTVDPIVVDTGSISAEDQTLTGNSITVQSVMVGQDSWLVAVHSDDEDTENFIAGPMWIEEGTEADVMLELNEDANLETDEDGNEISLQLYADNGTMNEWDDEDELIRDANNAPITETITVYSTGSFADYDTDADGFIDENEFPDTFQNDLATWDVDGDGSLSRDEFYNTTFANTDVDNDDLIDEDEWNTGYTSMYGVYTDDDFATYDADADGFIDNDEWNAVYVESGWYETYDADSDSMLTEDEWNLGLYNDWDTDDDDMINPDEYYVYSPYTFYW